ncbi:MAG TPA: TRAP transporter small permease [Anaerovoracaceae bacterium]|nr:TRAP transporter small permease [Anaerovoracaceae bacterium]
METKKEKWYDDIEANICVLLALIMLVVLSQQIVSRYVFRSTSGWADESARYMLVWFAYFAASVAIFKNAHIKIDAVLSLWPVKVRPFLKLFSNVIFFVYCVVVMYFSYNLVVDLKASGAISLGIGIPMWIVYSILPIGHLLWAIRLIQLQIKLIKNPELLEDKLETDDETVEAAIKASKEVEM